MRFSLLKYGFFICGILFFVGCNGNKNKTAGANDAVFQSDPKLRKLTEDISSSPKDAALYFERGTLLRKMGLDTLALKDYKKAASLDSTRAEYYSMVGDVLFEHKDIAGSVQWLQKAIALNPNDRRAHLKIAKMFLFIREYAKGFAEINIVLRKNPYDAEAYFLKGMLYKDMKDTAKAISSFHTAVQVSPGYVEAVMQLGLLYAAKNDPIGLKFLDNAFKMDSTDVSPLYAKGVYFEERKDFAAAKAVYKECIVRDNHFVDAYFRMGYLLLQQDSFAKAYRQYDIVTKVDPGNATAYYNRGVCSELMDSLKNAVMDYQSALRLDSSYKSPREALARLKKK